jgi:hypothetical protein
MGHYGQTMISGKAGVRQDEELESHLNKGQFVVESPFARFVLLQFCFFFEVSCLYKSIKGPYKEYKAYIRAEIANIPAAMSWLTLEMGLFTYSEYRTCI